MTLVVFQVKTTEIAAKPTATSLVDGILYLQTNMRFVGGTNIWSKITMRDPELVKYNNMKIR